MTTVEIYHKHMKNTPSHTEGSQVGYPELVLPFNMNVCFISSIHKM